jgi:hypothetical protein
MKDIEFINVEYRMFFYFTDSISLAVSLHSPFDIRKFDIPNAFQIIWQHQKPPPLQQHLSR